VQTSPSGEITFCVRKKPEVNKTDLPIVTKVSELIVYDDYKGSSGGSENCGGLSCASIKTPTIREHGMNFGHVMNVRPRSRRSSSETAAPKLRKNSTEHRRNSGAKHFRVQPREQELQIEDDYEPIDEHNIDAFRDDSKNRNSSTMKSSTDEDVAQFHMIDIPSDINEHNTEDPRALRDGDNINNINNNTHALGRRTSRGSYSIIVNLGKVLEWLTSIR